MRFIPYPKRTGGVSGAGRVHAHGLYGTDLGSSEGAVSFHRAAEAVNLIRSKPGSVAKRGGYSFLGKFSGVSNITCAFCYYTPTLRRYFFISGGNLIVTGGGVLEDPHTYSLPVNMDRSRAIQIPGAMVFMNGSCMVAYRVSDSKLFFIGSDGTFSPWLRLDPFDLVYTPTVFVGGSPGSSAAPAEQHEPVNLISPFVTETFCGNGSDRDFTLHYMPSASSVIIINVKNASGEWENAELYSRTDATLRLLNAPPAPAVAGEDNVKIVYMRQSFAANAWKIAGCTCAEMFGVAGYKDRLFVSGNAQAPDTVWYSQMDNQLYFPDLNYIKVGAPSTRVTGLSGSDTRLAVICRDNVFLMDGAAASGAIDAVFTVSQILETPAPAADPCPCVFDGETVYLTERGVIAITPSGIMDERNCVLRSELINSALLKSDLSRCRMISSGDWLVISDGDGKLFLLDSRRNSPDGLNEGYVFTGVPAHELWDEDGRLCFSDGGAIYRFEKDFAASLPVMDEKESGKTAVCAIWRTPALTPSEFHRIKYFDRLGILLESAEDESTGVRVTARFDSDPERLLCESDASRCLFRYGAVSYPLFSFSPCGESRRIYLRLLHKRCRKVRLCFENGEPNETFALGGFTLDYLIM